MQTYICHCQSIFKVINLEWNPLMNITQMALLPVAMASLLTNLKAAIR